MQRDSFRQSDACDSAFEDAQDDFKPLTPQEAQEWRKRHPALSVWRIVGGQALVGVLVVLVAWLLTRQPSVAWSAGYGALSVLLPSTLFARAMARKRDDAGAVVAGFLGWELVKIALTIAMLVAAPRLVAGLSWLALLAGMVVVMKMYWIALAGWSGRRRNG
ncbi:ATP synthase subunit I [Comamonas faecalis]|uniref:ATP synthase subunit I n=1 Tax=Comamonas faecalis TaxID=1387849 RepID=A0ABP7QPK0_9BURK